MIDMKLEEHSALMGVIPRSYTLAVIPLILYLIYKVRLSHV